MSSLPHIINATPQVGKPSQSHHTKLDQAEVQMRFERYCEGKDFSGGETLYETG